MASSVIFAERLFINDPSSPVRGRGHWTGRRARSSPVDASASAVDAKPVGTYFEADPAPDTETEETIPEVPLFVTLEKSKKPYGHVAYRRRDPRTGKMIFVRPKGVKVLANAIAGGPMVTEVPEAPKLSETEQRLAAAMNAKFCIGNVKRVHKDDRTLYTFIEKRIGKGIGTGVRSAKTTWVSGNLLRHYVREGMERILREQNDYESISNEELDGIVLDLLDTWVESGALKTQGLAADEPMRVWSARDDEKAVASFRTAIQPYMGIFDFVSADGGLGIQVQAEIALKGSVLAHYMPSHNMIQVGDEHGRKGWESFAHEYGHYLDFQKFGTKGKGASESDPDVVDFVKLITEASGHQAAKARVARVTHAQFQEYWNRPVEIMARWFNEWFHQKVEDAAKYEKKHGLIRSDDPKKSRISDTGWEEWRGTKEFQALSDEFEALLDRKGVKWKTGGAKRFDISEDAEDYEPVALAPFGAETEWNADWKPELQYDSGKYTIFKIGKGKWVVGTFASGPDGVGKWRALAWDSDKKWWFGKFDRARELAEAVVANGIMEKGGPALYLDLAKSEKPYGHVAYTRRDPRTGKLERINPKGVKPTEHVAHVVQAPEPAVKAPTPKPGKTPHVRWSKHLDKKLPLSFLNKPEEEGDLALFEYAQKRGVKTLRDFVGAIDGWLKTTGNKVSHKELSEFAAAVVRAWIMSGHLTVATPEQAEAPGKKEVAKHSKPPRWKTCHNPGLDLPDPYKHRGLIKNAIAEEMGWSLAKYLASENPAMQPDETFVANFCADLAHYAGVKVEPSLRAVKSYFAPVVKAWLNRTAPPKKPKVKAEDMTPKTHPYQFAIIDGKPDKLKGNTQTLWAGRIFTGAKNEEAGPDARNKNRGKWCPAVKEEDVILNGTSFPKGWPEEQTKEDPSAEYYAAVRVPRHVNAQGWVYVRPEHIAGKVDSKWENVTAFASSYPKIMERVRADLKSHDPRVREIAAALVCLDVFHPRVDSDATKEDKDRFGLTSLLVKHMWTKGKEIHYKFTAKSFDVYDSKVMGPGVVDEPYKAALDVLNALRAKKKPDERIFSVSDTDLNDYIHETEPRAHAHHFRHYHANLHFKDVLEEMAGKIKKVRDRKGKKWSKAEARRQFAKMLAVAGQRLGHRIRQTTSAKTGKAGVSGTGTVRDNYLHPALLVNAMQILGYDLRSKKEKRETAFAAAEALMKALNLDRIDAPPVYVNRYVASHPWQDYVIEAFAGWHDEPPYGAPEAE